MSKPLLVGAVAYTPNVVTIWEGIRDYFAGGPAEMDFVLFSNYGRQVDALLAGTIDVAWNTNLAWVRTVVRTDGAARALAMRDVDTVFRTIFVARAGNGLHGLDALRGRRLALGSKDSAQAAILPVHLEPLFEAAIHRGDRLRDPDDRVDLEVALRAHHLLDSALPAPESKQANQKTSRCTSRVPQRLDLSWVACSLAWLLVISVPPGYVRAVARFQPVPAL